MEGHVMNFRRRDLPLLLLLAALAMPAFGKAVALAVESDDSSKQSIPDFSGIWLHPSLPGFEPLSSAPTSLVNRSRRNGVSNVLQLVGDYTNPILKPEAAEVVKKYGEISLTGKGFPTPRNQCWPGGVPFVFASDDGMQLLQEPDKVTILHIYDHQVRHARLNQSHPAHVIASWYGDSVAHYEGDTLVIDTVGLKVGPFAMVDWYGTPHTPALHVIERYRLLDYEAAREGLERDAKENFRIRRQLPDRDQNYLQLRFTVEDEGAFTTSWTATMTFSRGGADWPEIVCAENTKWFPGNEASVPTADKPDF
jgi:hypothetical protein